MQKENNGQVKLNRNHPSIIITSTISDIKSFIPLILLLLIKWRGDEIIWEVISFIPLIILVLIKNFLKWKNTVFNIQEGLLNYESGTIFKKKLSIPINKIATIDLGQNIFQQILKVHRLKIDSGSVNLVKEGSEIDIVLKEDLAIYIRNFIRNVIDTSNIISDNIEENKFIESKKAISDENKISSEFKISIKELFIAAITRGNIGFGIGLLIATYELLQKVDNVLEMNVFNKLSKYVDIKSALYTNSTLYFIYFILVLFIVFLVLSIICSVIGTIIKFYDFKIYKKYNYICIEYGLISKKEYSLPIESITAIKLKQNLIKQKFGLYRMEVSTVGYGDEHGEEAIIYPVLNKDKVKQILKTILPEFDYHVKINKPPKEARRKFMFIPVFMTIIICGIIMYIKIKLGIIFCILPIVILSTYLNYRNTGMGFNHNILMCIYGGFHKQINIVKIKSVQSISTESNYFQRKKNLCNYSIDFYSSKLSDLIEIKNLKNSYFKELEDKIEF